MSSAATVLAWVMGAHILVKFAVFALPYPRRRTALDRAYGTRLSATATSDVVLLLICVGLALVVFLAGRDVAGFLIGLWIGATLIQIYFHRFHAPLAPEQAPAPPVGPIKLMSYAIQADPWRPWPQLAVLTGLVLTCFVILAVR